jgi:hypothetical protein
VDEDQPPLVAAIAERHEEHDPGQEPAEGQRRHPADRRRRRAKFGRQLAEHRRVEVNRAGGREDGQRQERKLPAAESGPRVGTCSVQPEADVDDRPSV